MTNQFNAIEFFRDLTARNKLAQQHNFVFREISGLHGLEEAIASMQKTANFVMVTENAAGYTDFENTPHQRRIRTVYFAMRYNLSDMAARQSCKEIILELHRQFCSKIIQQNVQLENNMQYISQRINLQEADEYLIPGTTIFMFELAVDTYINLEYNSEEWDDAE